MLPILRILPVGGVLLAIVILALALSPPGGSRPSLTPAVISARGVLMQTGEHPEWRHFLILAATRRADELNRLRELPDTAAHTAPAKDPRKVAGLPADRSEADPDDATGSIIEAPRATIPVEIGETSSTELPVSRSDEKSPAIRRPERAKPPHASRQIPVHRTRRATTPARPGPAPQYNLFEALFNGQQSQPSGQQSLAPAYDSAQSIQPAAARAEQQ
jgi:hypothetical protein